MINLFKSLQCVQIELKAPKNQVNSFGKYNYRSCEDILEAVKPLLAMHNLTLNISDEMIQLGERYYVKSTAQVFETGSDGAESIGATGYAREPYDKKGADDSQITGSASSYARKYALNGLFLIDDTKDADATNDHGKAKKIVQTMSQDHIKELGDLAKKKGYTDKALAINFLNEQSKEFNGTPVFTQIADSDFENFKRRVITAGWNTAEKVAN